MSTNLSDREPHKISALDSARKRLAMFAAVLGGHRITRWLFGAPEDEVRPALAQGLLASILITVGSWGVGSLPQAGESLFSGTTILVPLRTETSGVIVSAILLIFGCMLLVRAWLRLSQRIDPHRVAAVAYVMRAIWLWSAPLIVSFPIFSRDVYSYLAQGRLYATGANPYENWVSQLPGWFMQGADGLWAESYSPYGPVFLVIAAAFWWVSGGVPEVGVLLFRGLSLVSMWLLMRCLIKLSVHFRSRISFALWMAVANPLFLIIMVAAAHNDVLMLALLAAGMLLVLRQKFVLGMVAFGASIAIKPIVLVTLPFLVFVALRNDRPEGLRLRERLQLWVPAALLMGGFLIVVGALTGLWFGWIPAMMTSGSAAFPYAPVGLLGLGIGWALSLFGVNAATAAGVFYTLARVSAAVLIAWWALRCQREEFRIARVPRDAALALVAVVLSAPIVQPWYLLWVLPLYVLWRSNSVSWLRWLYLSIAVLVLVGVIDQFSVAQWIPQALVQLIAVAVGLLYLFYIVLIDPKTTAIFRPKVTSGLRRGLSVND